jgi:hypothetical protein
MFRLMDLNIFTPANFLTSIAVPVRLAPVPWLKDPPSPERDGDFLSVDFPMRLEQRCCFFGMKPDGFPRSMYIHTCAIMCKSGEV